MYNLDDIRVNIQPVPKKVSAAAGAPLKLTCASQFCFTAPAAEKGPVKTAGEDMKAYLTAKCGEDCFSNDGIAVTLELGDAPAGIKNEDEGYRITVTADGITITGFGASGLFYGVVSFKQMCDWNSEGCTLPAVEVLDWPDYPFRALHQESRYGCNLMEKEDWFAMIDDLAAKKYNNVSMSIYSCWCVQYDGKVAEFLYTPLKDYPQLKTPQTVKFYSPTEGKWYNYETLPPIYRDNFLGELIRYAKDRAIDIIPSINSFGHNTLFPANIPEVSPKDENGVPTMTGFCTSSEETYKLLFSFYDDIIDNYLLPNNIYKFFFMLDEVWDQYGANAARKDEELSPWCKCEKCRDRDRIDIFFDHAFKLITYLKKKGMKSVLMCNDMFARKTKLAHQLSGNVQERMLQKVEDYDVRDVLLTVWWNYTDFESQKAFAVLPDEVGLRSVMKPWNGYQIWSILTTPFRNIKWQADLMHQSTVAEGLYVYALWDKSYDLMHDFTTDYSWNYEGSGEIEDTIERYVQRHYGPAFDKALFAYKLLDRMNEARVAVKDPENPLGTIISYRGLLTSTLSYYTYCYYKPDQPFPRHFPGQALKAVLEFRNDYERCIYAIRGMAKEAVELFTELANTAGCDQKMARRMAYECHNYVVLMEDWLAFLKIYDLTQKGDQKKIAPIAKARKEARLALMAHCEQVKEAWAQRGAAMREQSVFMQTFADIEAYINSTDKPKLDLFDITPIMSKENWMIR